MPQLSAVLQNNLSSTWESVSSVARTLNFTLTGRDNAAQGTAQTNTDAMVVTVNENVGPFAVTSQNTDNIGWTNGTQQAITWSVNNTNTLAGSTNVNIKLSTDGGLTYPVNLALNTPNDGSETITVPADIKNTNCRLLIEPTDNIYYAVNSKQFAIGYDVTSDTNTYTFAAPVTIPDGNMTYTTRIISVPAPVTADPAAIIDVDLNINFTHTYLSDVQISIMSPTGTIVPLFDGSCGSTSNTLSLKYDDSGTTIECGITTLQIVIPAGKLSDFNNQSPYGNWTLMVRDIDGGKTGTINSASITIQSQKYTLGTDDFENIDFVLYPNPNKGNFTVQFTPQSAEGVKIYVHDILGKAVYSNSFVSTDSFSQNIQLLNVSSGIYLVTIIDGDRKTVKKIVVN
jgi:subtilisin-like proprotein convertase family protein